MKISVAVLSLVLVSLSYGQNQPAPNPGMPVVYLWPSGAPGFESRKDIPEMLSNGDGVTHINNPSLTAYLPSKETATGVAVIIAPGGGHSYLAITHEGYNPAKWFADHGIAAFVLKYRLARERATDTYQTAGYQIDPHALQDMQRAIKLVRSRASEWNIDPAKVGAMGFSAGGELAERVALKYDNGDANASDPIEKQGCKPAFQALIYPGTSGLIQPVADSPPAFMAAGNSDRQDISQGLAEAYLRFKAVNVPAELHMYAGTGHGFGVRDRQPAPSNQAWTTQFVAFLTQMKFIDSARRP